MKQTDLLTQLSEIGMSPSEYGVDETAFVENEVSDNFDKIDMHIEGMQELIQSLDASEMLYLVSSLTQTYQNKFSNISQSNDY